MKRMESTLRAIAFRSAACCAMALVVCVVTQAAFGATPAASAAVNVSSTKDRGVVSIVTEPTLSDGRLIMKVVAFNRRPEPATFSDADVKVFTAAGKPVALFSLNDLIADAKRAGGVSSGTATDHDPSFYSHPGIATNGVGGAGEPDVAGYTGANNPTSGVVSSHTHATSGAHDAQSAAKLQESIANLKAAILQPMAVGPAAAAGGQVVTQKLKFSRKESHALRVVVEFNGEEHEFSFDAPPAE
jgi:hypothetical protein